MTKKMVIQELNDASISIIAFLCSLDEYTVKNESTQALYNSWVRFSGFYNIEIENTVKIYEMIQDVQERQTSLDILTQMLIA